MMQYYQIVSVLDAPEHDRMLVHSRLDIYLRNQFLGAGGNTEMVNIPSLLPDYAFHLVPQTPERSVIMLRSAAPLNLPGEKAHEIHLEKGAVIDISVLLCSHSKTAERDTNVVFSPRYINEHIQKRLAQAGFEAVTEEPRQMLVGAPKRYLMKRTKNTKGKTFSVYGYPLSGEVRVIDTELATSHFISGIGTKRAYGFGLIMEKDRR